MQGNASQARIGAAIRAANDALAHLERAADLLDDASRWGVVDMLGGSFATTLLKHRKIDDAQDEVDAAKRALQLFVGQIDGIEGVGLNVELGGVLQFFDLFCDNVINDLFAQRRIKDSQRRVDEAIREVRRVRDQLCRMWRSWDRRGRTS